MSKSIKPELPPLAIPDRSQIEGARNPFVRKQIDTTEADKERQRVHLLRLQERARTAVLTRTKRASTPLPGAKQGSRSPSPSPTNFTPSPIAPNSVSPPKKVEESKSAQPASDKENLPYSLPPDARARRRNAGLSNYEKFGLSDSLPAPRYSRSYRSGDSIAQKFQSNFK